MAVRHTFAALNTFMVTDVAHIHATVLYAGTTVIAAVVVHMDTNQTETVKKPIYGTKWTEKTAE